MGPVSTKLRVAGSGSPRFRAGAGGDSGWRYLLVGGGGRNGQAMGPYCRIRPRAGGSIGPTLHSGVAVYGSS